MWPYIIGGGVVLALILKSGTTAATPKTAKQCYDQKSRMYAACQKIDPAQRAVRNACFVQADAVLATCLKKAKA